jgi:glycosyltransferase involved in cell wall biosynthesis
MSDVFLLDITGRFPQYTFKLFNELTKNNLTNKSVYLGAINQNCDKINDSRLRLCEFNYLKKRRRKRGKFDSILKLIELSMNVSLIIYYILTRRPRQVHLQYLPFISTIPLFDYAFLKFTNLINIRTILTVHNILPHDSGLRFYTRYKNAYSMVNHLIVHTEEGKSKLIEDFQINSNRITVIPHGIIELDPSEEVTTNFDKFAEMGTVLLFFGGLAPYKGIERIINFAKRNELSDTVFLIMGLGNDGYFSSLKNLLGEKPRTKVILLNKYLSDSELSTIMDVSSAVLFPYEKITFSGAVITAMTKGKLVICSDLVEFESLVSNGYDGLLVDWQNDMEVLRAIDLIKNDGDRCRVMGERAKEKVYASYNWRRVSQLTMKVYDLKCI